VDGRALAVTLLRCVGTISRETLATRPFAAGPDVPTPDAQMIGTTAFSLGLWPSAEVGGLLATWERFALPLVEAGARGGGGLPDAGSLLEVVGEGQLSSVRRLGNRVEVTLWNHHGDQAIHAIVGGHPVELGPAGIGRIEVR
jgi:mannosylglycerate hydrolase